MQAHLPTGTLRCTHQIRNFHHPQPGERMDRRDRSGHINWIQQSAVQSIMSRGQNSQVNIAAIDVVPQLDVGGLSKVYLDAGIAALVARHKWSKKILDDLCGSAYAQGADLAAFEGACPFFELRSVLQQLATALKKVFTLRRQLKAPADPIEQGHSKLFFECQDLP
jgi:hypothetical protein